MVPPEPPEEALQNLMKQYDIPRQIAYVALMRAHTPEGVANCVNFLKSRNYKSFYDPKFHEIKILLVKHRALEFALNMWNHDNPMLKNFGFAMIPLLVQY